MEQNNTYKYLSVVLAIIAIVFAVLYFTKKSDTVTETFQDVSTKAAECRTKIADWQQMNGGKATTTEDAREDLMNILNDCQDTFQNSQERI